MAEKIDEKLEEVEPTDVMELEDGELEGASGGLSDSVVPVDDGNCHNTQCCGS
jgi:hypothetical protein